MFVRSAFTAPGKKGFMLISTVPFKDSDALRTNRGAKQQVNYLAADANRKKEDKTQWASASVTKMSCCVAHLGYKRHRFETK